MHIVLSNQGTPRDTLKTQGRASGPKEHATGRSAAQAGSTSNGGARRLLTGATDLP